MLPFWNLTHIKDVQVMNKLFLAKWILNNATIVFKIPGDITFLKQTNKQKTLLKFLPPVHSSAMINSDSQFSLNGGVHVWFYKFLSLLKSLAHNFLCSPTYLFIFLVCLWRLLCCYVSRSSDDLLLGYFNSPSIWLHSNKNGFHYQTAWQIKPKICAHETEETIIKFYPRSKLKRFL